MRLFIKDYIDKLNKTDIIDFGLKNDIFLSEDEASTLMFYLKNNWEDILYGDPAPIIYKIKESFGCSKGEKIVNLFNFYKDKYRNYL